jgi:hypothetical protein
MRSNHPHNHHQPISPPKKISYPENLFFLNKVDVNRRLQFPACNERIFFSLFHFLFLFLFRMYYIATPGGKTKQKRSKNNALHTPFFYFYSADFITAG